MNRPTAEIVLDLRKLIEWYGVDPGVPMSAVDIAAEAADRLTALEASYEGVLREALEVASDRDRLHAEVVSLRGDR